MFRGCLEITLQWNWLHLTRLEHLLLFITCTAKADPLIMIGWPCWWRGRPAEDGRMKSHQGKRKAVGQRLPFFQHNIKGRRWNCLETFSSHFLLSSVLRVINSFKEEAQGGGGRGWGRRLGSCISSPLLPNYRAIVCFSVAVAAVYFVLPQTLSIRTLVWF